MRQAKNKQTCLSFTFSIMSFINTIFNLINLVNYEFYKCYIIKFFFSILLFVVPLWMLFFILLF